MMKKTIVAHLNETHLLKYMSDLKPFLSDPLYGQTISYILKRENKAYITCVIMNYI